MKGAAVPSTASAKPRALLPLPAPPAGTLSPECADLVALGDPADVYAAYESALGTSALASQLKKIEKSFHMPVTALHPPGPGSLE